MMKISFPDFQFTLEVRVRKLFEMLRTLSVFIILLHFSVFAAPDPTETDLFQKGLAAYQNRKYDEARDAFQKLLDDGAGSARLMHNLALTYYQMNQKPRAIALWRKALVIDPDFRAARAGRDMMEKRLGMRPYERDSANLWLRRTLEFISFFELLWVMALVIAICGWLWIRYWADRRTAVTEERPLPGFPLAASLIAAALLFCISLIGIKAHYAGPRATVVNEATHMRSLPSEDSVSLFEINGGSEVLVKDQKDGWTQVQNSEGNTGWVKNTEILLNSEG